MCHIFESCEQKPCIIIIVYAISLEVAKENLSSLIIVYVYGYKYGFSLILAHASWKSWCSTHHAQKLFC